MDFDEFDDIENPFEGIEEDLIEEFQGQAQQMIVELTTQINTFIAEELAKHQVQLPFLNQQLANKALAKAAALERIAKKAAGIINKYL